MGAEDAEHIVKIHRPIYQGDDMPWVAFDQLRARMTNIPDKKVPKHVKSAMRPNEPSAYFRAKWDYAKDRWIFLYRTHSRRNW